MYQNTGSWHIGSIVSDDGYFTKAVFLRGKTAQVLETALGYRTGRLGKGWFLLFMVKKPDVANFGVRGYSHMSGGIFQGHLPSSHHRDNAEESLGRQGVDIALVNKRLVDATFTLSGPQRLARVVPVRPPFGDQDYPKGTGIPQWELKSPVKFKVAAVIAPGGLYQGNYQ